MTRPADEPDTPLPVVVTWKAPTTDRPYVSWRARPDSQPIAATLILLLGLTLAGFALYVTSPSAPIVSPDTAHKFGDIPLRVGVPGAQHSSERDSESDSVIVPGRCHSTENTEMSRTRCRPAAGALLSFSAVIGVLTLLPPPVHAQACDRACLTGLMTQFIDALVAHDPSKLPLADNVRYTEDSRNATLGDGIWRSVTASGGFRQDYIDTRKQVAAAHLLLRENETQVLYSVVLHVSAMKIAGIETLVQRVAPGGKFQPTELGKPIRGMNDPVPPGQRDSRDEMIRIALTYPEGLRVGNFTDGGTPFADDAYRVENGVIMADQTDPRRRMYEQNIIVHPGIIASVAAVDEENGTVLLWMNFGHTGNSYGVGNALVTFEAFKVWGGKIRSVNAFFKGLPISTARFWPSSDPVTRR